MVNSIPVLNDIGFLQICSCRILTTKVERYIPINKDMNNKDASFIPNCQLKSSA